MGRPRIPEYAGSFFRKWTAKQADHRDEDHPDLHLHDWLPAYSWGVSADLGDSQAIPVMSGLCVTSVMPTNGKDSGVEPSPPSL